MEFNPHNYQQRAIDWVISHPRCLLFLEMGLGKTAICLTAAEELILYGEVNKILVIAPRKVAECTWSDEAARWDHISLRVSNILGTPKARERAVATEAEVYVIGRDSVVWLTEYLGEAWDFDMVIIDELTSFKNHRSLRFKALRRMLKKVPRIVGLTGTPTPKGYIDLWAQVYCIDGGERLGKYITAYRERWFNLVEHNHIIIKCTPKKGAQEEIMDAISDIALAMRSEDWLELPPVVTEDVRVDLGAAVMKRYRQFEKDRVMQTGGEEKLTADSAAACINKLSQFANGAMYGNPSDPSNPETSREIIRIHDEKLAALREIFESERDSPLLVFYAFKHDRDRIMEHFADLGTAGVRCYTGARELRDWNAGLIDILLCHPASTAYGLNMQHGGSRIVWFSTGWDLELYQQANARLHRQGQTHTVRVFNLIATDTVDERMLASLRDKGTVQRDVMVRLVRDIMKDLRK